jgi:hypothetical protein
MIKEFLNPVNRTYRRYADLREKLVFRADVELVPEGTLPRFEIKAKLIRKLYEGE